MRPTPDAGDTELRAILLADRPDLADGAAQLLAAQWPTQGATARRTALLAQPHKRWREPRARGHGARARERAVAPRRRREDERPPRVGAEAPPPELPLRHAQRPRLQRRVSPISDHDIRHLRVESATPRPKSTPRSVCRDRMRRLPRGAQNVRSNQAAGCKGVAAGSAALRNSCSTGYI